MRITRIAAPLAATLFLTLGSAWFLARAAQDHMEGDEVTHAIAVLHHTKGSEAHGVIHFTKVAGGVKVEGKISGLKPGKHGFHVHEFGDCSDPEAKSAGGHFNPGKMKHAGPDTKMRHVGDLGNIEANAEGVATISFTDSQMAFHGHHSIIGRGLIVHEKADDLKTQPTGDAGGRVACAVIGVAKGK